MTNPLEDRALLDALRASHYPGASDASIYLLIAYCRAMQVDPMLKPAHIVPMEVEIPGKPGVKEKRDVIMPGIGLYRIIAERSSAYLGKAAPELGPMIEIEVKGDRLQVPEWISVTVRKLVGDRVAEFTAREYWIENYGQKTGGFINAMWKRRPIGQLAKCCEAQALRQAFPDLIPAGPTIDERVISAELDDADPVSVTAALPAPDLQAAALAEQLRARAAQAAGAQPEPVHVAQGSNQAHLDQLRQQITSVESVSAANQLLEQVKGFAISDDDRAQIRREIHQKMRALMHARGDTTP